MIVAVRSEIDSRPLVYPMLRVLNEFGSVCIISSNRFLNRLIDNEDEGGFRNIRVIVDESGASDSVFEEYGIAPDDFDYIILDNMGLSDYDILIVPLGEVVTDDFQYDVDLLKRDANVRFVQFGKGKKSKSRPASKPARPARRGKDEPVDEENDDPAAKFQLQLELDEEYNVSERSYDCGFPTWQEVEDLEAKHKFYKVEQKVGDAIYDIFKHKLAIDKRTFDKTFRKEDDGVIGHITAGEADIDSNPKRRRH